LNAWLESDARRIALREVESFIDQREQQVATAFSGWFTFGDAPGNGKMPPNWKQAMVVLLTLFSGRDARTTVPQFTAAVAQPVGSYLYRQPAQRRGVDVAAGTLGQPRLRLVATPDTQRFSQDRSPGAALIIVLYAISVVGFAWISCARSPWKVA
jgi:hypothetical protein